MVIIMSLSARIKEVRLKESLSLAKLGEKIGEKKSKVYNMETERQKVPGYILQQFVTTFDVNPCWLLTGKGNMYQSQDISSVHTTTTITSTSKQSIENHRKARMQAFLDYWFEEESADNQVWLEMQLSRSIPEYKAFISRKEME